MRKFLFGFWFLFFCTISSATTSDIILNYQNHDTHATGCLLKFMHAGGLEAMLVSNKEKYNEDETQAVLYKLMEMYKSSTSYNIAVNTCEQTKCNPNSKQLYEQYFVFADSINELSFILTKCLCSKWSSTARFIIVTNHTTDADEMLEFMKKNLIFKALLVTSWNESFVTFRHAKPRCPEIHYSNGSFHYDCLLRRYHQQPSQFEMSGIAKCRPKLGIRVANPYIVKLNDKEVERYKLRFRYVGIEIHILGVITHSELMPFSVSGSNELGVYSDADGSGHGLMKELVDGEVDLLVGAMHNIDNRPTSIDSSYPLLYGNLIGIVKKRTQPTFYNLVNVFSWDIWLVIFILVVVFAIVTYIVVYFSRDISFSISSTVFSLFAILIGQDGSMNKKHLRLILLAWVWITFMLRSSYEAYSTFLYISKDSVTQVDSLEEVCRNNYKIFVPEINYAYLNKGLNVSGCNIPGENFILAHDSLNELMKSKSDLVAVFMYRRTLVSYLGGYTDVTGRVPFHVMKEEISMVPLFYYFRRGDPLLDMFQNKGMTIFETGLIERYRRHIDIVRDRENYNIMKTVEHKLELSLKQVAFVFYGYLCGLLISIVTFIIEIVYFYFTKFPTRAVRNVD